MSHVTGIVIIDAPASALNNGKAAETTRADNTVPVKFIKTRDGDHPYVSAQAVRYWLRTQLAATAGWEPSPVYRENKIAYTSANPIAYDEDDLFGYMRAPSGMEAETEARTAGLTPLEEEVKDKKRKPVTLVRIAPFRVGTVVSVTPVRITQDFGTMSRSEGDPVPHEHQFYRAHLKGPVAVDLGSAGTFFVSKRTGFKNLDSHRTEAAKQAGATEIKVRGLDAWRLPQSKRAKRVAALVETLGQMEGGAKQTLHLTDVAPSILALCVCKSGNQPLQRLFTADPANERTVLRLDVLAEILNTFGEDIQSDFYLGWATGFLDEERASLEKALKGEGPNPVPEAWRSRIHVSHPREAAGQLAALLQKKESEGWFA